MRRIQTLATLPFVQVVVLGICVSSFAQQQRTNMAAQGPIINSFNCEDRYSLCTERQDNQSYDPAYKGRYIGHDEPSLLFYSNVPGSGNYNRYTITLPKDPATFPTDAHRDGSGLPTVWNFQLHPAFWFGMALCDTESYPEFTHSCKPDTDANIFDSGDPDSPKYIGHHPGTAFLELQFYPPGWVNGYTQTQYAAAVAMFSFNLKPLGPSGPIPNNNACLRTVGIEPANLALITVDGKSQAPADPLNHDPAKQSVIPGETFLMSPGDTLVVTLFDTPAGLRVTVQDLTSGQTGSMTASQANGFAQVIFDPGAATCQSRPYAFHPMYATSSPHTRVPWAAHTYNVAFSDEIGHFNYCDVQNNSIFPGIGACLQSPVEDEIIAGRHEPDDFFCVDTASSIVFGSLQPFGGCLDSDGDFDGVPYHHAWAGSGEDPWQFSAVPDPIRFTSAKFLPSHGGEHLRGYSRVAFEADMPAIETPVGCSTRTGVGCTNPPPGSLFYPIYTTTQRNDQCWWQFGGAGIPGTTNTFGGNSTTEFGELLGSIYIAGTSSNPGSIVLHENFRRILPNNPCSENDNVEERAEED
jgi:hypothetical protein